MPSKSAKQHRFIAAAAHNPEFAKRVGIAVSVAKEFVAADKHKSVTDAYKKRKKHAS